MIRSAVRGLILAATLVGAGCSELVEPQGLVDSDLQAAFSTMPIGYSETLSTFSGQEGEYTPETGTRPAGGGLHQRRGPGHGGLMGGGLIGAFMGDGMGRHLGANPFGVAVAFGRCPFDSVSGRLVCEPVERRGLTIIRSAAFLDAAGLPQAAYDSVTTNSVNARVSVEGTIERLNRQTTVDHTSDRTIGGLADGSTQRTVDGASAGTETTVGSNENGEFTIHRTAGDTIQGVVIPLGSTTTRPYPTAGTIIRSMRLSLTREGAVREAYRREKITFDGSQTATIEITIDGNTPTCSLPLPHGRPTCP